MKTAQVHLSPLLNRYAKLFQIGCILLQLIFIALEKFFPKYAAYVSYWLTSHYDLSSWKHIHVKDEKIDMERETETRINREEVGFIMSNVGISLSQEGDQLKDYMSHEEFLTLFDQIEPGLHEVKEVFSIFDQNKDGFIDAKELQTVLINLGLREGTDLDICQSMINRHDRNQDGKIELSEFSKLLESALI
ncbi:hypothetical protein LUZ63_008062 [Rhynchospora breviuscula]|uniref:EF-hand domain-containing protein n=1 Tax=Rhynchospora breviuscula TaxID=2022672 RepID=A0A9Q0CSV3_9POAL|nr:hypothetical protein LUZ63_008062 [Rhynchospora breviuscula]